MRDGDIYTLEIFRNLMSSIAGEMGTALFRTAFSPNIKERRDHSCAVFDPKGRLVAQAEHIPVHLGSLPRTVEAVLEAFELKPGDLVVTNDPFLGGTHLPDISMVSPVYSGKSMIAILASRAHHSDVGGFAPGSLALTSEIFQEGLIIPPVRLRSGGDYQRDVEDLICANTRNPAERSGDLQAQVGAHNVGEKRVQEADRKYGPATLNDLFKDIMGYSEKLTRAAIGEIPDGSYRYTDYLDDDGMDAVDIPITATVEIKGDEAAVDFIGTSPPVTGPLNCPVAVTLSATYYVFRCVGGGDIPASDGSYRPLHVKVPESCLLNARPPSAVAGGNVETSQRIVDTLLGALHPALPHLVPAASCGTMNNLAMGSGPVGETGAFSYYETIAGGSGGGPLGPGVSGTHTHMTNTLNTPVEALEYTYPIRVRRYCIRRGSFGTGRHSGGDGLEREIETLVDCRATIISERRHREPYGLAGGQNGKCGRNTLVADGEKKELPSKCNLELRKGDRILIETPGGGGWGPSGSHSPSSR